MRLVLGIILIVLIAAAVKFLWLDRIDQQTLFGVSRENNADKEDQIIQEFDLEGFDEEGNLSWRLDGESAHIDPAGDVFIERNVILRLEQDTRVFADKVFWQNSKQRFMTNQPVKIKHAEVEVDGVGAMGRLAEKFIQINQNIRMIIHSGTIVTCHGPMKVYQDENRMALFRDVWILDQRGAVSAQRMDAIMDPETRTIQVVVARGNVRISRGDDVTYADTAIYDVTSGSVKLEGSPQIEIRDTQALQKEI